jgi:glycosyltransferase involved in cell wall biosynthesis
MKIVQLFKIYWPDNGGGIATVMESIATAMKGEKQEIVVCQAKRGRKSTVEKYQGVPVYRCSQLFDFASTPFSIRFLQVAHRRTKDSDITIYHFPYPMIDLAVLFGLVKGKLVVWWHCDFDKYKLLMPIYNVFVRHTLNKADRILVSAQGNIDHSNILCDYKEKCTVIPYCVDESYLESGKKYLENQKNGKQHDIVHILFMGRMVWYKGCDVLLRAFKQMKHKNCTLTMLGEGPLKEEWKQKAQEMDLTNVVFTGMVSEEEKKRYIEGCDFLVLPSISKAEAFALVQIEAMAYGKPVINTDLPSGVPYISIHGKTGLTVEPKNVRALADAMDKLVEDEALRKEYGKNARQMVEQEYTQEKMTERHRKVFEELLK